MLKLYAEWLLKLIILNENMNKIIRIVPLYLFFAVLSAKNKLSVSGSVITTEGEGIKKASILLLDSEGEKVKDGKSKKDGTFKLKKVAPGTYTIKADEKNLGSGIIAVTLTDEDIEVTITIPSNLEPESLEETVGQFPDTTSSISDLKNTSLDSLPQQREPKPKPKLELGELFFNYESNLKALQSEIDSLKTIVQAYDHKQKMPDLSHKILELINVPTFHHRIELQNGTVVLGNIEQETDSSLTLATQIGRLVLKKEMVIRMEEYQLPAPKVEFLGDPFIDYYPDRQILSGRIKNVGEKRADFVRIIGKLWDQTTSLVGTDSIFVKGTRVVYDTDVIADTALDPGQITTYTLILPFKSGTKPQYHTMDIHWEQTQ